MLAVEGQSIAEGQTPNGALRHAGNLSPFVGVKVLLDPVFRNRQERRPQAGPFVLAASEGPSVISTVLMTIQRLNFARCPDGLLNGGFRGHDRAIFTLTADMHRIKGDLFFQSCFISCL